MERAVQNFQASSAKDHFLYNSLYNRDVEFMKNLIRTSTGGELERNPNPIMLGGEYDPRQVHDHQHRHNPQQSCFAPKAEHLSSSEHHQRLYQCANGTHMLPIATRSFSCSQLSGLVDYPNETIKRQQHQHQHQLCKSEKPDEDDVHLSGKCQMHSNSAGGAADGGGILVKTEFNEMQQSKSSPVHETFEMASSAFTSTVTGSGSCSCSCSTTSQFHHDSGSSPLPHMEAANSSSSSSIATHHHQHQAQHQCSAHSYESYVYASGSGGRVGMSPRQPPPGGTTNTSSSGSEISGGLYSCKSFFADSSSGSASSGIASFYPNSSQHQSNSESCREDSSGFPGRDSLDTDEKVVIAIKPRKIPD